MANQFRKGKAPATITSMLSAISYNHKILGFSSPVDSFPVKTALKGLRRSRVPDSRKPITLNLLMDLVRASKVVLDSTEWQCFSTVCCVLFFGFFRISELLGEERRQVKPMRRSQAVRDGRSYRLLLTRSKTSDQPATVKLSAQNSKAICPVRALDTYLQQVPGKRGVLFRDGHSTPLTPQRFRRQLAVVLQSLGRPPAQYPPHSFRIGAATHAAELGLSDAEIRHLGRWRSSAFLRYVRHYRTMSLSASRRH